MVIPKSISLYFYLYCLIGLVFILLGILTQDYRWWIAPVGLGGSAYLALHEKWIFLLIWASIPLSDFIELAGGMSIDFPAEIFMVLATGLGILFILLHFHKIPLTYLKHPLTVLLFLQLVWIIISGLFTTNAMVTIKYFLAKCWYIIPCYAGVLFYLVGKKNYTFWLHINIWVVLIVYTITLTRHATLGFAFDKVNKVMYPFFQNHVDYACLAVILLPYFYFSRKYIPQKTKPALYAAIVISLAGIYFSYTRAAYIAVLSFFGSYLILKFKLVKPVLWTALVATVLSVGYLVHQQRYLQYAPEFDKTISHHNFENLMEATAKGQDISTMERVYRWVAGGFMVKENWLMGVGAGNFYNTYKRYTVSSFQTYVSNNPEKSGIHCNYLMVFVEQGLIGFLLFVGTIVFFLIRCQTLFHRSASQEDKSLITAIFLSMTAIVLILIINDMVENIKVGPYFYMAMGLLAGLENRSSKKT